MKTIGFKGEYERISDNTQRPKKSRFAFSGKYSQKLNGYDAYPISEEDERENQCQGFGHSYYKPGGFSTFIPQNAFVPHRSSRRKTNNLGPPQNSRGVYSKIPTCDSDEGESPQDVVRPERQRLYSPRPQHQSCVRKTPLRGKNIRTIEGRKLPVNLPSADCHRVANENAPLASSSRNTTVDGSGPSVRQDDLEQRSQYPKNIPHNGVPRTRNLESYYFERNSGAVPKTQHTCAATDESKAYHQVSYQSVLDF